MINDTNISAAVNLFELTKAVNDVTNGNLMLIALVATTFVLFIGMKKYDTKAALVGSMFVSSLTSVLLFSMGFIASYIMVIPIMLFFVSVMVLIFWD